MDEAGELLLHALNDEREGGQLLYLHVALLLVHVKELDLALGALGTALNDLDELLLVLLDAFASDVAQLSVLADLVGRASAVGVAVDVDDRLLAHVEPYDLVGLGVGLTAGLVDGVLEAGDGRLAAAVDLKQFRCDVRVLMALFYLRKKMSILTSYKSGLQ